MLLPVLPSVGDYEDGVGARRAPASGAPVNLVAPFISGTATTGQVLSCNGGSWAGASIVLTYQWKRAGVSIGSATSSTYTLVALDEGAAILCAVTATNGSGNASANSNSVTPAAAGPVPLQSATVLQSSTLLYSEGI